MCETLAVRFLDSGQQHLLSLLWPFLQPSPWQLIAVGSCALQPVCCNILPSAKIGFSFGVISWSPRGGDTPRPSRGNVLLDSMHPSARQMQSHISSIMSCGKARSRLPRTAPCVGAIGRTAPLWLALNSCVGSHSPHAARPLVRYKSRRGEGVRFDPGPKCASSPTARAARSPRRHLSSSGSAERLWSKDRAASPSHHRRSVGRLSARRR